LNAYFSKARVASRQDLIHRKVDSLCHRIAEFAGTRRPLDIGAVFSAFQRDVSTDYVLGKNYDNLKEDDFGVTMTHFMQGGGRMWCLTKHLRWYGPLMHAAPRDFLIKNADANTASFMLYSNVSPPFIMHCNP
jgi:hypothetical protein